MAHDKTTSALPARKGSWRSGRRICALLMVFLLPAIFLPRAQALESGPRQVNLLEVYSSEGCSSCPPAEQWLTQLEQQPGLWNDFVPVVFHVDYWDYLGWKDSLASPLFSDRQRRYARIWNSRSVYTPGFVLNGKEWRSWRSESTVPGFDKKNPGRLSLQRFNEKYDTISFTAADSKIYTRPLRAHLAILGHPVQRVILRGENAGKTLRHPFVVIAYGEEPLHSESGFVSALVEAKKTCSAKTQGVYVTAWVSDAGTGEVIQAAGGKI